MSITQLSQQLETQLAPYGLSMPGWFSMFNGPEEFAGKSAVLVCNRGRAMWNSFCNSAYLEDGQKHPLDRWTKSVIEPLQAQFNAVAFYPFLDGSNNYWPFQQWAKAACGLKQSPPGLLIDPQYGLWQAFRAVLVFEQELDLPELQPTEHPCNSCAEKPCLTECPVDAISSTAFNAELCRHHVNSDLGTKCRNNGCIARNACPVGRKHAYTTEQQKFHMRAYLS